MEMSYFNQYVDNLKNKYLELRAIEKRSNAMMQQVIDTFYLIEGLNRLQSDLDCLDILIKKNSYLERVIKLKIETRDEVSRKSKLGTLFNRSLKAITSSDIYKQIKNKLPKKHAESAFNRLKRITHAQRVNISELADMVQCTIVTNYEVLDQLQQISCLHLKNVESWSKEDSVTNQNEPQQLDENLACEEQNPCNGVQKIEVTTEPIDPETSQSNISITTLCKNSNDVSTHRPKRIFTKAKLESIRQSSNRSVPEGAIAIGDGQAVEVSESVEAEAKGHTLGSCKSTEFLARIDQLKGDFVEIKSEEGKDNSSDVLKKIIDSKSV